MNLLEAFEELNKCYEEKAIKKTFNKKLAEGTSTIKAISALEQAIAEDEAKIKTSTSRLKEAEDNLAVLEAELTAKKADQDKAIKEMHELESAASTNLLGKSVFLNSVTGKKAKVEEIKLTSDTLVTMAHTKIKDEQMLYVKYTDKKHATTYLQIISDRLIIRDSDVNTIIEPMRAQQKVIDQINTEIYKLSNEERIGKVDYLRNTVHSLTTEINSYKRNILKNKKIIEDKQAKAEAKKKEGMAALDNVSTQVKDTLVKGSDINVWTAIGWLAKHTTNLRVIGPEDYYKAYYEDKFGPGYTVRYSSGTDWPGGTLFCDAPFSANDSAFVFVSEAIKEANLFRASITKNTKEIVEGSSSTNCLALVYMLLDEYNFIMGEGPQPVDKIRPTNKLDAEAFDRGFNS